MSAPLTLLIEVHAKDQSLMNQDYSWENLYYIKNGKRVWRTFKPTIRKSVSTKKRHCDGKNTLKVTSCFDSFYMTKLNCSFPWISNDGLFSVSLFHIQGGFPIEIETQIS